ncbi:MAG: hypothetical protein KDB88_07435, partial [Flavobacteriales bacterium]|nr:hypothetical protein [Flavobacteriales bacterium]
MKQLTNYIFPALIIVIGGVLLMIGAMQGQNSWVLTGAALALVVGVIMLLLQLGIITRRSGTIIGALCALGAIGLGYRDYRSVQEVIEFNEQKREYDSQVIQGLKDVRTAQLAYKQANGVFANDLNALKTFVKQGSIPMIRAIGQVPDTLTEEEALELKIIVRDTIEVPALDSLFLNPRAMEGRVFPFEPDAFVNNVVTKEPFILRSGTINSSGRDVPVFVAKDRTPMVKGDTLMVGSLEKASTSGNWSGE